MHQKTGLLSSFSLMRACAAYSCFGIPWPVVGPGETSHGAMVCLNCGLFKKSGLVSQIRTKGSTPPSIPLYSSQMKFKDSCFLSPASKLWSPQLLVGKRGELCKPITIVFIHFCLLLAVRHTKHNSASIPFLRIASGFWLIPAMNTLKAL